MGDTFRILAVCTGNVNRSALAATLLRTWADWYLPPELSSQITVDSAGLRAPVGEPMRWQGLRIAEALGANGTSHRAQQIDDHLLSRSDLVLTASTRQRDAVLQRVPASLRTVFTIREAGRIAVALRRPDGMPSVRSLRSTVAELAARREAPLSAGLADPDGIVDPEGRGDESFRQMAREEVPALAQLGSLLFGMPQTDLDAYVRAPDDRDLLR